MILAFDRPNKLVIVPDTETEVTVQEIYDQCRDYEDRPDSLAFLELVDAEGKTNLGGGEFIVVTLFMINGWRLKFDDRLGMPDTVCRVSGGNILGRVGNKDSAAQHPIAPSDYTFPIIYQATTGLILTDTAATAALTSLETDVDTLTVYARAKKVTSQTQSKLLLIDAVSGRTFEAVLYGDEAETEGYDPTVGIEVQGQIVETT
jgi:hypothetical protein